MPKLHPGPKYQQARKKLYGSKIFWGKRYTFYGAGNNKAEIKARASKRYSHVHIVKMPAIIKKTDPKAANYAVYVRGRKK